MLLAPFELTDNWRPSCRVAADVTLSLHPRFSPGAAFEWSRIADSTCKLFKALCQSVIPDIPGAQTASVCTCLVWPSLKTGRGDWRTWRWDSGTEEKTTEPILLPFQRWEVNNFLWGFFWKLPATWTSTTYLKNFRGWHSYLQKSLTPGSLALKMQRILFDWASNWNPLVIPLWLLLLGFFGSEWRTYLALFCLSATNLGCSCTISPQEKGPPLYLCKAPSSVYG